jgi:glycosyltransferase involved in cell wall biosynthesis
VSERPAVLLTGEVPDYRREPFRLLDERQRVDVVAWRETGQLDAVRRIASGRYRAVICGLGGRIVLPGSYLAARRAQVPFVLWTSIWAHPRTAAHALSRLPTRWLYHHADAVVTYGRHVTEHVGRADKVFEAPQAVDPAHFGRAVSEAERNAARARLGGGTFAALFVGRLEREKGPQILLDAWQRARIEEGTLALAGAGPLRREADARFLGRVSRDELPALYAAADVLVLPSIATATFTEPWGLVVNEAMLQGTPVIASDAVGAVAGGLVRDGRNGLTFAQGDASALAARLSALAGNEELRKRLGDAAREDVRGYTPEAWAEAVSSALEAVGAGRAC